MWQLNLPEYTFRVRKKDSFYEIFDVFRKKYVRLTPEEWVRQNFLKYLVEELHYPLSRIAVEKQLDIQGMKKRFDAVVYDSNAIPWMILEFKSYQVALNQEVVDQASVYNSKLNVSKFVISNGLYHLFYEKLPDQNQYLASSTPILYPENT